MWRSRMFFNDLANDSLQRMNHFGKTFANFGGNNC